MERTTDDGREVSTDGGRSWLLVEPSPAWTAARPVVVPPPAPADVVAELEAKVDALASKLVERDVLTREDIEAVADVKGGKG